VFVDNDKSSFSGQLISKFNGSDYFKIVGYEHSSKGAEEYLLNRQADLYIEIPANFEKQLVRTGQNQIHIVVNAIDGTKGGLAAYYSQMILKDYLIDKTREYAVSLNMAEKLIGRKSIDIEYSNWFNEHLDYKTFMVPGVLVLLITMIGAVLAALNIVREKEIGTLESINVTPIRKYEFILAKLLPIWIIGIFELSFGLIIALILFNIPLVGSPLVLFAFAGVYLLVALGIGLLISTMSETMQQAILITWFFLVLFILLGGLFTAIENMPKWAQMLTHLNPVKYFIEVVRMVMLKGAGFAEIRYHFMVIGIMAVVINALAVLRYRKTT
jgi:ABC-2 type transport system permease protein